MFEYYCSLSACTTSTIFSRSIRVIYCYYPYIILVVVFVQIRSLKVCHVQSFWVRFFHSKLRLIFFRPSHCVHSYVIDNIWYSSLNNFCVFVRIFGTTISSPDQRSFFHAHPLADFCQRIIVVVILRL